MSHAEQPAWMMKIEDEMNQADSARAAGNEGMARVCARRAAGIILGEYFEKLGIREIGPSVVERLNMLKSLPNTSQRAQEAADHLLLRVDHDHKLPVDVDLIEETRWLINHLQPKIE